MIDRELTDDELDTLQSCGNGEQCIMLRGRLVKVTAESLAAMFEAAFKSALAQACHMAGIHSSADFEGYKLDEVKGLDVGRIRVTATHVNGASASAIGFLPDPRGMH